MGRGLPLVGVKLPSGVKCVAAAYTRGMFLLCWASAFIRPDWRGPPRANTCLQTVVIFLRMGSNL